jgi:hypothetical protein
LCSGVTRAHSLESVAPFRYPRRRIRRSSPRAHPSLTCERSA